MLAVHQDTHINSQSTWSKKLWYLLLKNTINSSKKKKLGTKKYLKLYWKMSPKRRRIIQDFQNIGRNILKKIAFCRWLTILNSLLIIPVFLGMHKLQPWSKNKKKLMEIRLQLMKKIEKSSLIQLAILFIDHNMINIDKLAAMNEK